MNDLKVVILKCPYLNWFNNNTPETFVNTVSLKLQGYLNKHSFGALPIDTTDFIADHLLICKENNGELVPILGVKALFLDVSDFFNLEFSFLTFLRKTNQSNHVNVLESLLTNAKNNEKRVSYYSSWTILPTIISDKEYCRYLKEIFAAITVLHHIDEKCETLFGIGVPKFKTDEFFFRWGYQPEAYNGVPLPFFPIPFLGGIDGVFMHLPKFSDYAFEMAEKYKKLWDKRVVLGESLYNSPLFQKESA